MSGVSSGRLRHKVQLQEPRFSQDPETGEMKTVWLTIARLWAEIVPMSAREFYAASAQQSEVRGRITIRYRENIDHTMRFVHRGKYYNIFGVMPDADSGIEHLTLAVGEGVRLT